MLEESIDLSDSEDTVIVSGATGQGIDKLLNLIEQTIHRFKKKYTLLIPYTNQSVLSSLYNSYTVSNVEYLDEGISAEVILDERGRGAYGKYIVSV
jgi:50S ribosomal subunit-associated GTPase HflX